MSHQEEIIPPKAAPNGLLHRNLDMEGSGRHQNKSRLKKSSSSSISNAANGGKLGHASSSRDRLVYVMTQLIGYHVDVHVKNGSVISGIFHATNTDKEFGIVLKMAQLIKDGSVSGQRAVTDVARKPQTMIIPARELVQVLAKDIALGGDELVNGPIHDNKTDIIIDSTISHFQHPGERDLERWTPDEDNSEFFELEKTDKKWNRSWDQFETNAALFGVKSTFNEEIYTTKLERGPHMRELEKQATRIAREIENEVTDDIHLAEERGLDLDKDLDQDEEIKYSAVRRDVDSSSFNLPVNAPSSACAFDSFIRTDNYEQLALPACSSVDKDENGGNDNENVQSEKSLCEGGKPPISEEWKKRPSSSHASDSVGGNKYSDGLTSDSVGYDKFSSAAANVNTLQQTGNPTSSASERIAAKSASSTPGLSPSSSMGSLSSEKSSLNPDAKEFKLNPNAKSFTPSSPLRPPQHPASEGSFYYPNNVPNVPLGPGLPMGTGFPSAFGGQPAVYNAQSGQLPSLQSYIHPGGTPYGQQMMLGQGRPIYYYAPEMQQYRGRGF